MFANLEGTTEQLVLLPSGPSDADSAAWSEAVMDKPLAFGGMAFRRALEGVEWGAFTHVTIVKPEDWPPDLPAQISSANSELLVDEIRVPTPDALKAVLNVRVYYGWRYGPQGKQDWAQAWPAGACLVGLHGRANGEMVEADYPLVKRARLEAIKITTHATMTTVKRLRAIKPDLFIMARPFVAFTDNGSPRQISPQQLFDRTASDLARLYDEDPAIHYIEIHNEPNLRLEGQGGSWNNGAEFGEWFLEVLRLFRQRFPEGKFGFPGLSPGPALREPHRAEWGQFLDEAAFAVLQADWVGIHSYWVNEREMFDHELGFGWVDYRRRFPEKLLFITEFGNPFAPKAVVGDQYVRYYNQLRGVPGLGAAFAYIASTSDPIEEPRWAWRDETGRDVGLAAIVGGRKVGAG